MRIAEITTNKKTGEKQIILSFDYNKQIIEKIKNLPGRLFISNSKIWTLPLNSQVINKLKELEFDIIEGKDEYKLKIDNILIENNLITILADDITRYIIAQRFIYFDYNACYKFGKFDFKKAKKIKLFYKDEHHIYIPIGFMSELTNYLVKKCSFWSVDLHDIRKKRKFKFIDDTIKNCLHYIKLRDYQIEAVKTCLEKTNCIVKLLPGTGKTEIFLALCKLTKIKILVLTNSIDLTRQTYDRGKKADLDIGIVQGNTIKENHRIIIATVQSSHKLKNKYEMVIVDECHEISQLEYNRVLSNENILYRFGFSATPFGKDKLKNAIVKQWLGEIEYTLDSKILQENNIIAIPNIFIHNIHIPGLEYLKSYRHIEKLGIIHNPIRNNKIIDMCKKAKGQVLILVKKKEHGFLLQNLLSDREIKSKFLYGEIKKDVRQQVLKEFDKNKNKFVLIGCKVLKQGISIENISDLILAGAGASYYETIQMIGRGLRGNTKKTVNIHDFMDESNRVLLRHSRQRIKDYENEGFTLIKYI
ncbi:MAG: DEAD/DEAH box helicase [Planctomycetota bacterium]|jgi:superfamily II DNA or RNA helicase